MSRLRGLLFVVCVAALTTSFAVAGEREDVLAVLEAESAAWEARDPVAVRALYHADFTVFTGNGQLLLWPDWKGLNLDPETKITIARRHVDASIYGNTAVIASYSINTATPPGESPESNTLRNTHVLLKSDGTWKILHVHLSNLTPVST